MGAKDRELIIPPAAEADPQSFEILRVWAADGEQHVTIESVLEGNAQDFGEMLVDLARHGANLYRQRESVSFTEALRRIREGFDAKWEGTWEWPTGGIHDPEEN
jgi:hypothetical protein